MYNLGINILRVVSEQRTWHVCIESIFVKQKITSFACLLNVNELHVSASSRLPVMRSVKIFAPDLRMLLMKKESLHENCEDSDQVILFWLFVVF